METVLFNVMEIRHFFFYLKESSKESSFEDMTRHIVLNFKFCAVKVCILICLFTFTNLAFAQKVSQRSSKKPACRIGGVSFVCPKGFEPIHSEGAQNYVLLFRKKDSYSLFVATPTQSVSENDLVNDVLKSSLVKLFPKEPQNFKFKPIDLSDTEVAKVSAKQIGGSGIKGYNGNIVVLEKHLLLKVRGKEFLVGYIAEQDRGESAKETSEFLGGEVYSACFDLTQVIYSITGEKVSSKQNPCNIEIIQLKP